MAREQKNVGKLSVYIPKGSRNWNPSSDLYTIGEERDRSVSYVVGGAVTLPRLYDSTRNRNSRGVVRGEGTSDTGDLEVRGVDLSSSRCESAHERGQCHSRLMSAEGDP